MNANCQNFCVAKEIGLEDTILTPDFRSQVKIWPFCACTMKNMQHNAY